MSGLDLHQTLSLLCLFCVPSSFLRRMCRNLGSLSSSSSLVLGLVSGSVNFLSALLHFRLICLLSPNSIVYKCKVSFTDCPCDLMTHTLLELSFLSFPCSVQTRLGWHRWVAHMFTYPLRTLQGSLYSRQGGASCCATSHPGSLRIVGGIIWLQTCCLGK